MVDEISVPLGRVVLSDDLAAEFEVLGEEAGDLEFEVTYADCLV